MTTVCMDAFDGVNKIQVTRRMVDGGCSMVGGKSHYDDSGVIDIGAGVCSNSRDW